MNTWIQIRDLAIASYLPLQPREQSPERSHTTRWHQTTAGSQPHSDVSVGTLEPPPHTLLPSHRGNSCHFIKLTGVPYFTQFENFVIIYYLIMGAYCITSYRCQPLPQKGEGWL